MNIRLRMAILVVVLVTLTIGLGIWRFHENIQSQATAGAKAAVEREVAMADALVKSMNLRLKDQLFEQVSREQSARQLGLSSSGEETLNRFLQESPFLAVGLMTHDTNDKLQTTWLRQRSELQGRWAEGFAKGILQDLPVESAVNQMVIWHRSMDPNQQPIFLMITQFKSGSNVVIAVGFLPATVLYETTTAFLDRDAEMAVVNANGFALAFSDQPYVGANLGESYPAIMEMLKRREESGEIESVNRQRKPVFAASERIENTNLYVLASVKKPSGWEGAWALIASLGLIALAMVIFGLGVGMWTVAPFENAFAYLKNQIVNIANSQPVGHYGGGNPYLDELKEPIEKLIAGESGEAPVYIREATANEVETGKMGAYREVSGGLAAALKDPLASVLAQAQIARAKSGQEELKEHFIIIEREARRARDTVDNLLRLTGEKNFPRTRVEVQDVVLAALASLKNLLNSHNVKVHKDFGASATVQAHAGQLQTAIEEVIKNAVEAMSSKSTRELQVVTKVIDNWLQLIVEDSGVGLSNEQLARVFEPFFTTKKGGEHKGLGMTVAKGIVKSFEGRMRLESKGEGQGARMVFEFPFPQAAVSSMATANAPKGDIDQPLTGTDADHLPVAPALDEMTFTGLKADPDEVSIRPPKVKENG